MYRRLSFWLPIPVVIIVATVVMQAQVTTATVYGLVVDPSGSVVPGAAIRIHNATTATIKTAIANEEGEFTVAFLPVGIYAVVTTAPGFKTYSESGLQLTAGQKLALNITLELGSHTETVSVSGERPLVQASSAEQNITIEQIRAGELPIINRDFTKLINLGAGVMTGSSIQDMGDNVAARQGTKAVVNGLAPNSFTFTVDGIDGSADPLSPSIAQYQNFNYIKGVSVEAIEEVQIAKNIFSAEISNAGSGNVNVITKGGTNELHGSVFELYRSKGLNARNPFLPEKTPLVYHQFGASLGGPFVKNKLFFFGVYEGYRQTSQTDVNGNVFTEYFRRLAASAVPAYQGLFDLLPLPNQPHNPLASTGFFQGTGVEDRYDNHGTIKTDWNVRSTDFVSFRFTRAQPFRSQPRIAPNNPQFWDGRNYSAAASVTHATPTRSLQIRFGLTSAAFTRGDATYDLPVPGVSVLGVSHNAASSPSDGYLTSFEETIAESHGRHSLTYGAIFQRRKAGFTDNEQPIFTYVTADEFLANTPTRVQFTLGAPRVFLGRWHLGGFIQDDIRVTKNLMVNIGTRYDYWSVPKEAEGRLFNRDGPFGPLRPPDSIIAADYNNFSPRLGFAWSLDSNRSSVIRGGAGVFATEIPFRGPMILVRAAGPNAPFQVQVSNLEARQLGVRYPMSNDDVRGFFQQAQNIGLAAVDPQLATPYILQWTLGLQRQLTRTTIWEINYVGNRLVKGIYRRSLNLVDRLTGQRPVAGFSEFPYFDSAESTRYNAMQTSLKRRFSSNLLFNLNYTWASNLSYGEGDIANSLGTPQDINNLASERGPTSWHVPHRLVADFLYELPLANRGAGRLSHLVLDGWQIGGILSAQHGFPVLSILQPSALPGSRPDYVGGSAVNKNYRQTLQYLNPGAFARVSTNPQGGAPRRPGNLGRGAVRGPGLVNLDLALSKNMQFTETVRLQLRVDLFNSLNHVNYTGVSGNITAGNFGRLTNTIGARQAQLSLRLNF